MARATCVVSGIKPFGAYTIGELTPFQPTAKEYRRLMEGEFIVLGDDAREATIKEVHEE